MGINATTYEPTNNDIDAQQKKQKSQSDDMRDTFLKMIVTQMQNQDPTKPMDNADLTSQLAQIASLESMNKLNDTVSGISGQIDSVHAMQAAQLVGKNVLIPGSELTLTPVKGNGTDTHVSQDALNPLPGDDQSVTEHAQDGGDAATGEYQSTPFGFLLAKPADKIEITIRDSNKAVVRTILIEGDTPQDVYDRTWDGLDDNGVPVTNPAAKFTFEVKASYKGDEIPATHLARLKYAKVNGVMPGLGVPLLDVGIGNSVALSDIAKVYPSS